MLVIIFVSMARLYAEKILDFYVAIFNYMEYLN
jgi:hypothetical protein